MITDDDLRGAIANHGKIRTQEMLEILVNREPYYSAIKSELGQLLLKKHLDEMKEVHTKIFKGDNSDETIMYAKALDKIFDFWAKVITKQDELLKTIKGGL